jgi:hypothetical protein
MHDWAERSCPTCQRRQLTSCWLGTSWCFLFGHGASRALLVLAGLARLCCCLDTVVPGPRVMNASNCIVVPQQSRRSAGRVSGQSREGGRRDATAPPGAACKRDHTFAYRPPERQKKDEHHPRAMRRRTLARAQWRTVSLWMLVDGHASINTRRPPRMNTARLHLNLLQPAPIHTVQTLRRLHRRAVQVGSIDSITTHIATDIPKNLSTTTVEVRVEKSRKPHRLT